ncbi:unnamed protein product [Calicophoron daubneyi]|uniref:Uncharacterized protein n=1 Tax=Calicophoron daubneyi TaxID=300641 RepID=A0AAV2TKA7_CALDB
MCVDMDPASLFEDALKGLATKDLSDTEDEPKPGNEAPPTDSHVAGSGIVKAEQSLKRNPLISDSQVPEPSLTGIPPNGASASDDIILNALINAGIAPASLTASSQSNGSPIIHPDHAASPSASNVKVLSTKGTTVLKILPKSSTGSSSPGQQSSLRMASQLIKRLNNENGSTVPVNPVYVPSIIRKRTQLVPDTMSQPPSKLRRTTSNIAPDFQRMRTANALFPSMPIDRGGLGSWAERPKLTRNPSSAFNVRAPNFPVSFVKPYSVLKRDEDMEEDEDLAQAETYADYVPMKLQLGCKHPDPVVESSSLSNVLPPDVRYRLLLPQEVIDRGCLSALQLEAVVYACQRQECILPNGQRAGFLVGDGAGVGKGRTIAGIIYENYLRHRKKAIWLSVSNDLKVDAERDLHDVGLGKIKVHSLNKFKYARISGKSNGRVKKGVIFSTYSSLIGESQGSAKAKYKTRLKQLVHWCGKKFDGVIVFDECHRAKNLTPSGSQKPTKTGLTVLELQNRLPNARIVYASATGATEPRNMAYMTRLGLWGEGTPFKTFNSFIQTLERRGVGAMELVAMDMKLRGMYIARQLSFHGVNFNIKQVAIADVHLKNANFIQIYNQSADLWVYAYRFFSEASRLLCPSDRYRKTMWGQFWSAHQRFFKYLCIAAKVDACVSLTKEALDKGECVVIGLQSTGEAKTLEQVEEFGSDLGDFVSTTKGVFQSLIEKYFPTSTNLENFSQRGDKLACAGDRSSSTTLSRAGRAVAGGQGSGLGLKDILGEKMLAKLIAGGSLSSSNLDDEFDLNHSKSNGKASVDSDDDDNDDMSDDSGDEDSESGSKQNVGDSIAGNSSSSDYYDSDLELNSTGGKATRRRKKKGETKNSAQSNRRKQRHDNDGSSSNGLSDNSDDDWDPDALFDSFLARNASWSHGSSESPATDLVQSNTIRKFSTAGSVDDFLGDDSVRELSQKYLFRRNSLSTENHAFNPNIPSSESVSPEEAKRQCSEMQSLLLRFIEKLGAKLPPSSLDELIDKLGGPSCVAEMTGRKGRMVVGEDGRVSYESRREFDVSLEILNLTEKQRFMDGEKLVAIISEAASSGISLQADRRAANQRRRVHITLELPWSADRAIQQFGRTHRSNQVSAPKYIFLISDLAGEQRFASTVAKRLESLGALTHGDRRATDTRDLSQFNIDTKLGREALDIVLRACINGEEGIVDPPTDYTGSEQDLALGKPSNLQGVLADNVRRFFVDVKASLQGVGLATNHGRERDTNQMSKFLNRMLGMRVHIQNALFRYFSDTLEELTRRAKRDNRLDLGIMDLGTSGQNLEIAWTKSFDTWFLSESTQVHLHKVTAERGLTWAGAMEIYTQHDGKHDGFYLPSAPVSSRLVIPILAIYLKSRPAVRLSGGKKDIKFYRIYRPNTGMQARPLELDKLLERYTRVPNPSDCQDPWQRVCKESATRCIHVMQNNFCPRASQRGVCEVGVRVRTYYVLSGSVLNVWAQIEPLLQSRSNANRCMQVVRLKSKDGKRIIGSLIPAECVEDVLQRLSSPPDVSELPSISSGTEKIDRHTVGPVDRYGLPIHKSQTFAEMPKDRWPPHPSTVSRLPQRPRPWPRGHITPHSNHEPFAHPGNFRPPYGSFGPHASFYALRPQGHPSPAYPTTNRYALPRHSSSAQFHRRDSLLSPQTAPVTVQNPLANSLLEGTHVADPKMSFTGVGYSLHSLPVNYTNAPSGRSVSQRTPSVDTTSNKPISSIPPRRVGSRLNAALSIPLEPMENRPTAYPSSIINSTTNSSSINTVHISTPPVSDVTISSTPLVVSHPHSSETTAILPNSLDSVKRPAPKMTKFKIKWKEG